MRKNVAAAVMVVGWAVLAAGCAPAPAPVARTPPTAAEMAIVEQRDRLSFAEASAGQRRMAAMGTPTDRAGQQWVSCVETAAHQFVRSPEAAETVVAASLSACSALEIALQEAWTRETNAIAAANIVGGMRRAFAGQLLTEIVAWRSAPRSVPASRPTRVAKPEVES